MAGEADKAAGSGDKGSKRIVVIAVAAVVLLAGGGAAAWYFLGRTPSDEVGAPAAATVRKPGIFVDLDPFTVNLADPGGERFAQIGLVLEIADSGTVETLKQGMPRLRNAILLLLSSKQGEELLTIEGKKALADEIAALAGESIGWSAAGARPSPVAGVHFSKFIVQ